MSTVRWFYFDPRINAYIVVCFVWNLVRLRSCLMCLKFLHIPYLIKSQCNYVSYIFCLLNYCWITRLYFVLCHGIGYELSGRIWTTLLRIGVHPLLHTYCHRIWDVCETWKRSATYIFKRKLEKVVKIVKIIVAQTNINICLM